MAAVLGLDNETVEECLTEANEVGYVTVANYNCPGQVVITGEEEGIKDAEELLMASGAKRVIRLAVSGAFHSEKMKPAADEFEKYFDDYCRCHGVSEASFGDMVNDAVFKTRTFGNKKIERAILESGRGSNLTVN